MDQRKRIILIAAVVLVVLGVLALLLRPKRGSESPASSPAGALTPSPSGALTRAGGLTNVAGTNVPEPPLPPPPAEAAVRQLAMTFAERYGSYSSEGNFVNVTDLMPLMTERYQRTTEQELVRLRQQPRAAEFSSTMTVVMKTEVTLPNGDASREATARVLTQRTDIRSGDAPRTYGQTLTVQLLKISEGWRVDSATWEKPQ
ncbi:hypothetical protein HY634_04220 [Candidatus Uhrbacteria bacterium]|nr:hypothetical protein [Candidatus Uhrbacteria bacterium]